MTASMLSRRRETWIIEAAVEGGDGVSDSDDSRKGDNGGGRRKSRMTKSYF